MKSVAVVDFTHYMQLKAKYAVLKKAAIDSKAGEDSAKADHEVRCVLACDSYQLQPGALGPARQEAWRGP